MRAIAFTWSIQIGVLFLGHAFGQNPACPPGSTNSFCITPDSDCLDMSIPSGPAKYDNTINDYIVSQHNIRRARVAAGGESRGNLGPQPASKCMAKLKWNDDLAKAAQNWVDQCIISGDTSRNKIPAPGPTEGGAYVGQNAYGYIDPPGTLFSHKNYSPWDYWDQAIQSWYGEVAKFDKTKVSSYVYSKDVGHYTQFVWGLTTEIGCGWRRWLLNDGSGRYVRLMVCNYWPGGNVAGKPVYDTTSTTSCTCTDPTFTGTSLSGVLCGSPSCNAPGTTVTTKSPVTTTTTTTTPQSTTAADGDVGLLIVGKAKAVTKATVTVG